MSEVDIQNGYMADAKRCLRMHGYIFHDSTSWGPYNYTSAGGYQADI